MQIIFKYVGRPTGCRKRNILVDNISAFLLIIDKHIIEHTSMCTEGCPVKKHIITGNTCVYWNSICQSSSQSQKFKINAFMVYKVEASIFLAKQCTEINLLKILRLVYFVVLLISLPLLKNKK